MTRTQKSLFWLGSLAIFILLLMALGSVLVPFIAGMAIAYFLDPVCDWLESHGLSRILATSLVTLAFTILLTLFFAVASPLLISEIQAFIGRLPGYLETIAIKAEPIKALIIEVFDIQSFEDLSVKVFGSSDSILKATGGLIRQFVGGVNVLTDVVSFLVLTPLVAFYFLRDWDRMVSKIDSWLPRKQRDVIRQRFIDIDQILGGFVRGQLMVCVLLGLFYAIGLSALGLEFGFVIGFFTGLVSFVPYFGMLLGFGVGMAVALAQYDTLAMVGFVALVFGAGQILEGYILTPRLVGNRVGLHPVWIIFALMAGGALFGFVGVLVAVPVTAVIGVLTRFALDQYMASPLYGDMDASLDDEDPPA